MPVICTSESTYEKLLLKNWKTKKNGPKKEETIPFAAPVRESCILSEGKKKSWWHSSQRHFWHCFKIIKKASLILVQLWHWVGFLCFPFLANNSISCGFFSMLISSEYAWIQNRKWIFQGSMIEFFFKHSRQVKDRLYFYSLEIKSNSSLNSLICLKDFRTLGLPEN